jgi:hypothetical protein
MNMKKRAKYRKHTVKVEGSFIPVKDWMRQNSKKFSHVEGIPTSEQIGVILVKEGYTRNESSESVRYTR